MSHPLTDIHRTNKYGETPAQVNFLRQKDSGQYHARSRDGLVAPVHFRTRCHMWVEFVVGSRPCSEGFFSVCSGFPFSLKPTFQNSNLIWRVSQ